MRKTIIAICFLLVTFNAIAQEEVLLLKNDLKTSNLELKQSFVITDHTTNNLSITLKDKRQLYSYLYNKNLDKIAEIKADALPNKYKIVLGSSVNENSHNIYFSNDKKTKFGMYSFDFNNTKSIANEIDLKFSNERFLQSVSSNNSFYIFTIVKSKSILKIYKFKNNNYTIETLDLSKERFVNSKNLVVPLYKALLNKNYDLKLEKIEQKNPNSIESASNRAKLYTLDNSVLITMDSSPDFTQTLAINLEDFTFHVDNIMKPFLYSKLNIKRSNSFIYDNNIFQLTSTPEAFVFSISDLKSKRLLKDYRLKKEDTIRFKNSDIIQEGGVYNKNRELKKTKQFLRKITQGEVGISIYKLNDKYQITLGGYKEMSTGGGMGMPGFGSIPIASFGATTLAFNPVMFAYGSYKNTKSTYINCLFDSDFNHVKGAIEDNVFDKISKFTDKHETKISAETIFQYQDYLMFGTSMKNTKQYRLLKFTD